MASGSDTGASRLWGVAVLGRLVRRKINDICMCSNVLGSFTSMRSKISISF